MGQWDMSREIRADYQTQYLFPRSLEEWVGPEDPARFIREFVQALDLGRFEQQEAVEGNDAMGRPHYAFELLLSVWLYGYVYGIRSSRELERACRQLLPLMWLAGTHQPDHNTLWRFWARYRGALREVFVQSVKVAMKANLVGMVLHAVDGTKIGSRASNRCAWHKKDLERLLAAVVQRIERLEQQIAANADSAEVDDRLPVALQQQTALRESVRTALADLEESKQNHLHPNDPQARMMPDGRGRKLFAYNAQAVVDAKAGVIVAADVSNEENDERQLGPMLDEVQQNVGENAETTVADSGYDTAEGLGHAEKMRANVVIASKIDLEAVHPYHSSKFIYDAARDAVQCPRAEWLEREGTRRHHSKPYAVKTYRCHVVDCPVRSQCSADRHGRLIEISPHHTAVVRNRQKLREPSSREALRKRGATVERIFAEIKEALGFRRWTVTGKEKVQSQWAMICTAMNLRRLIFA